MSNLPCRAAVLSAASLLALSAASAADVEDVGAKGAVAVTQSDEVVIASAASNQQVESAQDPTNQPGAQAKTSSGDQAALGDEIVVTAQKREERLIDVPISISVLDGADLDKSTREGALDALRRVPGVFIADGGNLNIQTVSIRGVTTTALEAGSSTTAYYVDAVPYGFVRNAFVPDAGSFDLNRVEVLRGPQGTLYGANALNGVVRILTNPADTEAFDLKARAAIQTTEGGAAGYRGDAAVNIPVVEGKLGVRASAGYQDFGGWIDKPNDRNANFNRLATLRLKARATPTDNLTIDLSGWWSRQDSGSQNSSTPEKTRSSVLPEDGWNNFDSYSAEIAYDFGRAQLNSRTSHLKFKSRTLLDFAPIYIAFGIPPVDTLYDSHFGAKVLTQELVLNSNASGRWKWTVGAMYRDAEDSFIQGFFEFPPDLDYNMFSKSFTVFGEVTRELIPDKLELTGGLRYFHDKVTLKENRTPGSLPELIDNSRSFEKVTPRAVLSWHPSSSSTVYASYAQGFRSGLQQDPVVERASGDVLPPTKPDTLTNYEVGTKQKVLGGLLYLEAAVFYIDWEDVHQSKGILVDNIAYSGLLNGGNARGLGAEVAVVIKPLRGLSMNGGLSWNDLHFYEVDPTTPFDKGDRLSFSPKYTASGAIDYSFPLGSLSGRVGASAYYQSKIVQYNRGVPGVIARNPQGDARFIARVEAGVESDRGWGAKLYIDNVTDDYTGGPDLNLLFSDWTTRPRPRTWGLQVEYNY